MTHHCDWQAHVETNRLACNSLFSKSLIGVSQIRFWVTLLQVRYFLRTRTKKPHYEFLYAITVVKVCMKLMCASVVVV